MAAKRYRALTAKPGELKLGWGREDRHDSVGIMAAWGEGCPRADGTFLFSLNQPTYDYKGDTVPAFLKELDARGYDLSTLKFSIQKKVP
ncbi:MAG: hypothetical protein DI537_54855 [Stutzerimonas stutzeri]|nr:MAG: hypothetical protein DI537_54855 [Stutzerimonas stutzeri]